MSLKPTEPGHFAFRHYTSWRFREGIFYLFPTVMIEREKEAFFSSWSLTVAWGIWEATVEWYK